MAHELVVNETVASIPGLDLETEEIWQARVDLAATLRISAHYGMNEGIDNHYSALLPGRNDLFLVNPYGLSFHEITASSLLVCDFHGNVIAGTGKPEASAYYIHARLHKKNPRARAAFHTHMPNATALCMVEGQPLDWSIQSSLKFYGRTAVDEHYNGLALDETEGDRIAEAMGDADVVFMRNHGVMVVGPSIAEAWDDLYYIERAAEVQIKALSTGRKTLPISADVAQQVYTQMREADPESGRLHLESVKRILNRVAPDYCL
ncbi:Decarboxylase NovR [compost metagenome]